VFGSLRGSDEIYRSILTHLVRALGAELAVLAAIGGGGVSSDGWKDCLLIRHAKHLWWAEEHDDWGPPISRLVGNGWERNVTLLHNLWGGVYTRNLTLLQATRDPVTGKRLRPTWNSSILRRKTRRKTRLSGSGAILLYLRMLVLRHLDGLPEGTYTHVVLTRSDLYHICDHQPVGHITQDEVYVPDGMTGGATGEHMSDRHHVFAFESRRRALAILPWLVDGSHPAPESYSTARNPFKPDLESVLPIYARAQGLSVRALNRTFFVAGSANGTTATRWGTYGFPAPLDGSYAVVCKCAPPPRRRHSAPKALMPGATRNSERMCVLADGREFVSAAQQCGLGKRACAHAADDVWVQRDPVSGMWLGKRGRGPEYQQVIVRAATRGQAMRERFQRLGELGEVATRQDALAHANETIVGFHRGVGCHPADDRGKLCRSRYWALRLMQQLGEGQVHATYWQPSHPRDHHDQTPHTPHTRGERQRAR